MGTFDVEIQRFRQWRDSIEPANPSVGRKYSNGFIFGEKAADAPVCDDRDVKSVVVLQILFSISVLLWPLLSSWRRSHPNAPPPPKLMIPLLIISLIAFLALALAYFAKAARYQTALWLASPEEIRCLTPVNRKSRMRWADVERIDLIERSGVVLRARSNFVIHGTVRGRSKTFVLPRRFDGIADFAAMALRYAPQEALQKSPAAVEKLKALAAISLANKS